MKKLISIALLMVIGMTLNAQNFITLQGRVTDSRTKKSVPYAAVAVQGTCVGTQANDQGEYKLKMESGEKTDTVVFSAIGYKRQTLSVEQLKQNGNVRLEPHALELREVQVTGYVTPQEIIAEAVRRIPENYHLDTTVGTWFQRDWRMLNGELYLFDESVVDMLRYGYAHDIAKRYYHFNDSIREMENNYKVVRKHRLLVYDSLAVRLAAGDMEEAFAPMDYSDNNVITDVVATPDAKQPFEIQADEVQVEGVSTPDYPLQKKRHSLEFLRTIPHLRPRTNTFQAVFRIRSLAAHAIHCFFQERGFVYVHTPLITSSDAEGAGEMFQVTTLDLSNVPKTDSGAVDYSQDFFGKSVNLTVSGQLDNEAYAQAFRNIYTFGPTFRAENSNTPRHLAEFWMIEPEIDRKSVV